MKATDRKNTRYEEKFRLAIYVLQHETILLQYLFPILLFFQCINQCTYKEFSSSLGTVWMQIDWLVSIVWLLVSFWVFFFSKV
ncbi:uncharacterized protein LOC131257715 isoform X2 [Magnolia sinica]|nr:uncharacterized protein LOC131257715 isoform X2 [Magnolia sinica]